MAQISNITLPNGSTYNLKGSIYTVIGTQTAATGSWTGELKTIDALYDGLTIAYFLPYNGSGDATLNLTLKNNVTTGAINCYYKGNARLTTHYIAGDMIIMTYWSAGAIKIAGTATTDARWIAQADYNSNTTYSAMSKAEAWTGTATNSRVMRADYLKQILANLGGTGLTLTHNATDGIVLNHDNYVTAGTVGTSSATSGSTIAIPYVTYNAQGHITTTGTHTHTVTGFLTSSSSLDASKLTGTVPTSVLPSYVDDVLEYTAKANFPATGEEGKIYVDKTTNLTWRWGGSAYVEISPSLAIGSTASTAAKGNHTHTVSHTPAGTVTVTTNATTNKTATVAPASSGTATYTPAGTVSQPTFTGTQGSVSVSKSYTPAGTVAAPSFTGTKATGLTVSPASSGTATYTPAGTVSQPTFTGTAATISVSKSYTPAGSVSTPTISVKTAGSTTTVNSITAVGTLPSLTVTNQTVVTGTSVSNEVMSFTTTTNGSASGWSAGTLPTKGANTTVKTGDAAYQSSQPSFTGTAATITSTGSYTPAGTVSQPTFTGTGKRLILQDYTPAGTNSAPAFTGTAATITSTGNFTPSGTVSQPTFTGTGVRLVTGNIAVPNTYTATFTGTAATLTTSVPA